MRNDGKRAVLTAIAVHLVRQPIFYRDIRLIDIENNVADKVIIYLRGVGSDKDFVDAGRNNQYI